MKTRTGISTLMLVLAITATKAQIRFQKTFGGSVLDWSNCIIPTTDSSYLILGSTKNFGAGQQDMLMIKTSLSGDTTWCKSIGVDTGDEEGATVDQTTDGGYIITGTTGSTGAGGDDFMLVKTDLDGNVQWSRTYGGPNVEFCTGGKQLLDGGYILVGNSSSFGAGAADIYLVRTDMNGDTLWTRTYGIASADYAYGIAQTPDSGFIVTGSSTNVGSTDLVLLKTNSSGDVMWSKAYGDAGIDAGYAVLPTVDGYVVSGSTTSFGNGAMDALLMKTDLNGDLTWSYAYGTSDSDLVYSLNPTADGGFVMTGYAHRSSNINDEVLLLKTDGNGIMQWASVMGGTSAARDVGRCAFESSEGSFLVSGFTQSFGGGTEAYLIKTDSQGSTGCNMLNITINTVTVTPIYNATTYTVESGAVSSFPPLQVNGAPGNFNTLCSSVAVNENEIQIDVTVYPNPMIDQTLITVAGKQVSNLILSICDISGKTIALYSANEYSGDKALFQISNRNLSPGLYIYSVNDINSNTLTSGKLVVGE